MGREEAIFTAVFFVCTLDDDYKLYTRNIAKHFVIDTAGFEHDFEGIQISVWAVSSRNPISFRFNGPLVSPSLLYKVTDTEAQSWVYAKSC